MPLIARGTALQRQKPDAWTLFCTFLGSFYSDCPTSFLKKKMQANETTGTPNRARNVVSEEVRRDPVLPALQIPGTGVFGSLSGPEEQHSGRTALRGHVFVHV